MTKRDQLIARLAVEAEPQVVPIAEFLDGNDDLASIGCNLLEHPGMDTFREVFRRVSARADVEAVYAQIAELDPGEESWPFADTVWVVGTIPVPDLTAILEPLDPDEVGFAPPADVPAGLTGRHKTPILLVWWD